MRTIAVLLIILGMGAAVVYPSMVQNASGRDLGTFRVYDRGRPFRPVTVELDRRDAPLRILVGMISDQMPAARPSETVLTITASIGGRTVLAETLNFVEAPARDDAIQTGDRAFRSEAGVLDPLDTGPYLFTVGPDDVEDIPIKNVDLVLRGGVALVDPRVQPIGFVLGAVGFIMLLLSFRGGGTDRPRNPNSRPPPRWGRAGADKNSQDG